MASELYNIIEGVSREKGIDPQIVVSAVEDAIVVATRKYYKTQENLRAELDKDSGKINAYAVKSIVETPEQVEDPNLQVTVAGPHRRATGQAGHLPEGARGRARHGFNEYAHRENEVLNATVKRIEGQDVIYDLGKAEARCPKREQSRLEQFAIGERVRVVISRWTAPPRVPQVIVSRAAPELVQNLFQRKFRRFTTARWSSAPLRAKPASAPRSPSRAATRTWTRWAPAWA
jgi:N utilization substance protein A